LKDDLYQRLREESRRSMKPATVLAREALEEWLHRRRRAALHADIAAYAAEHAGSRDDLDPALEAAGIESIARTRNARSRKKK
jgi:hypothetical protein